MHPYRTRFKKEIVAEFFPPLVHNKLKEERVIIFCSGEPGAPGKGKVLEFWAKKGFWAFNFRYRGTWESGGRFLRKSPEQDVLDIIDGLSRGFTEAFGHKKFRISRNAKIFLFGMSFGGPAAILASRDPRVAKIVTFSPVVNWRHHVKHGETNAWTERFTREAFGEAYRFSHKDWKKLDTGRFYNPMNHIEELDGRKIMIIHAKDDEVVPAIPVKKFAKLTGSRLLLLARGGHVPSDWFTKPKFYRKIVRFLKEK